MPKSTEQVNLDLEDLLVSKGYEVTSRDSSGKEVPTADTGEIQQFHFHREGKDYGTVTISIDGLKNMTVYYDDEIANSGVNEDDMDADRGMNGTSWISLVKQLKKFAQRHQLGFVLKDADRLRIDMKRRKQTEKELRESYDGIGFSVRSDILWPSTLFESTNPKESEEFNKWIQHFRETSPLPDTGNKCILAMCVMSVSGINIFYGVAKFIGETETHYILDNGHSGENEYAKKNQLVFNSRKSFEKFRTATILKFMDKNCPVNSEETSVMEAFSGDKQRMKLNKMFEGAELKRVKREYNQAAKNAGGDFDGTGKKIDDQKKGLRQKDIGKDKTVTEAAYNPDTFVGKKGTYKGYGITQEGPRQWGISSSARKFLTLNAAKRHIDKNLVLEQSVAEGSSKRDQKDIEAIKAAIARLESQLKHPNADKADIQQSIAHEKKRLALYGKDLSEGTQMKLDEGYYGNKKMSYNDDTPSVKMIIKHNRQLEETDQRFRHIEKIFLETSDGERFGVPTNKPSRARMFARHIAEGGGYKDERWNHIAEISEDIDNLGGFIRATRSSDQFTESAQRMIGEAVDKYHELRETAKRLQSGRGYNSYFESYEPAVENDNDDDLLEVFKHSSVDSRIEKAMPTLNKLGIRRGKLEEADMFEQWADSIIDESLDIGSDRQSRAIIELFADELPVGPNAEVAIGELSDIIEDDALFDRLRRAASVDPNSDARPQIIAWMQEQEGPEYRELLTKIDIGQENSEEAEVPKPEAEQPEEPQSEEPAPEPQDDETLPMKETDNSLKNIKRLSGL